MTSIGTHDFEVLAPNLFVIRYRGTLDGDEAAAIIDHIEQNLSEQSLWLLEANMVGIKGASPEARKIAADGLQRLPEFAMAIVSENMAQRIIAKLVLTAVSMLGKGKKFSVGYFSNSDDARDWLRSRTSIESRDS